MSALLPHLPSHRRNIGPGRRALVVGVLAVGVGFYRVAVARSAAHAVAHLADTDTPPTEETSGRMCCPW